MAGVTRVGATKQYSDNWNDIFGGKRRSSASATPAKAAKPSAKRKPAKKKTKAAKKSRRRK
jgi:hypothetical protein